MANAILENYKDKIDYTLSKYPDSRSAVMPLLYVAQEHYGYLHSEAIEDVADILDMDPTQVKSIAGFYTMYRETPKGKVWLHVCTDLPCALRGADAFYHDLLNELQIEDGETTSDGMFTCEHVMCLGSCDTAPMLQANFRFHESLNMDIMKELLAKWRDDVNAALNPTRAGQEVPVKKA
ncbi:MAG UNVERIFIED_CONTAM: NAD(P)H-dependent oxidoreductase subunit E [Anaerolineae bacterium]|jgi:NADH-quinone oxidoreductase subunit E